jgi:hypothetical protein
MQSANSLVPVFMASFMTICGAKATNCPAARRYYLLFINETFENKEE